MKNDLNHSCMAIATAKTMRTPYSNVLLTHLSICSWRDCPDNLKGPPFTVDPLIEAPGFSTAEPVRRGHIFESGRFDDAVFQPHASEIEKGKYFLVSFASRFNYLAPYDTHK